MFNNPMDSASSCFPQILFEFFQKLTDDGIQIAGQDVRTHVSCPDTVRLTGVTMDGVDL